MFHSERVVYVCDRFRQNEFQAFPQPPNGGVHKGGVRRDFTYRLGRLVERIGERTHQQWSTNHTKITTTNDVLTMTLFLVFCLG
jgi:hypothetical protein